MTISSANCFCVVSAEGTGGIGVIELSGPDARRIAGLIFRPRSKSQRIFKPGRIYLGDIFDQTELIDEVIVNFIPARESFNGLDTVEINAHGGMMPCRRIGQLLKKLGAKEVSQNKWIELARFSGALGAIESEALKHLLDARSEPAALALMDQYNGALSRALKSKSRRPELRRSAVYGLALTRPTRTLIIGRPNTGKSTLFNALLGFDRALTAPKPGTTRDTVEEDMAINGFPFRLVDTAGLRDSTRDMIERIGIDFTRREIPKADLILIVVEPGDRASAVSLRKELATKTKAPVVTALNKADLLPKDRRPKPEPEGAIQVSALKRTGLERLKTELLRACGLDGFKYRPGRPMVFTRRQLSLIR